MKDNKSGKKVLAIGICVVLAMGVTACSSRKEPQTNEPQENAPQDNNSETQATPKDNAQDSSSLFANANLQGSVVEFSDTEISVSMATTETADDGGEVMAEAAPGMENKDELAHITYTDDTLIQLLVMDRASQTQVSLSDAEKSSIKKQTSVLVFGSCQDTYHWTADKVVIIRWQ
ncbi:MAG: hypothetical protein PHS82_11905 [Lachnospiraceae bacterium]|nr:hypothetical protein [Lachnospiraceae bacterium]